MMIFRLTIVDESGSTHQVTGNEEVMRGAQEEIIAAMAAVDGTAPKVVKIHGMFDSADRAEVVLAIRPDKVVAVSLLKMYG